MPANHHGLVILLSLQLVQNTQSEEGVENACMCRIERNRQCALCLMERGMGYRKTTTTIINLEGARLIKNKKQGYDR